MGLDSTQHSLYSFWVRGLAESSLTSFKSHYGSRVLLSVTMLIHNSYQVLGHMLKFNRSSMYTFPTDLDCTIRYAQICDQTMETYAWQPGTRDMLQHHVSFTSLTALYGPLVLAGTPKAWPLCMLSPLRGFQIPYLFLGPPCPWKPVTRGKICHSGAELTGRSSSVYWHSTRSTSLSTLPHFIQNKVHPEVTFLCINNLR